MYAHITSHDFIPYPDTGNIFDYETFYFFFPEFYKTITLNTLKEVLSINTFWISIYSQLFMCNPNVICIYYFVKLSRLLYVIKVDRQQTAFINTLILFDSGIT